MSLLQVLSQLTILGMTSYILLTLTSLGFIIDHRYSSRLAETLHVVTCDHSRKYVGQSVPHSSGFELRHLWHLKLLKNQVEKSLSLIVFMFRPTASVVEMFRCVIMVTMQRYSVMRPLFPALAVATEVGPLVFLFTVFTLCCFLIKTSTNSKNRWFSVPKAGKEPSP